MAPPPGPVSCRPLTPSACELLCLPLFCPAPQSLLPQEGMAPNLRGALSQGQDLFLGETRLEPMLMVDITVLRPGPHPWQLLWGAGGSPLPQQSLLTFTPLILSLSSLTVPCPSDGLVSKSYWVLTKPSGVLCEDWSRSS